MFNQNRFFGRLCNRFRGLSRGHVQRLLPVLVVLWVAALLPAAGMLLRYEWTAGAMAAAPAKLTDDVADGAGWTKDGGIQDSRDGLLIVAIHPLCSCTRATLEELETSAAGWKEPYRAEFLIYSPKGESQKDGTLRGVGSAAEFDWRRSAYVSAAQRALHARVVMDAGGAAAARLGALTSGEVLYYSAANGRGERRLLFSGGVTGGRGMVGENGGIEALERAVRETELSSGADRAGAHTPVYGCGLAALSGQAATAGSTATASATAGDGTAEAARRWER
jgi:hypothetical protein